MNARKIAPEVQAMFERYTTGNTRRLARGDAVRMLEAEFGLSQARSVQLFDHFDKDTNGFMSLWEFNHFYNIIGSNAKKIVETFERLDSENRNYLDVEQAWEALSEMTTPSGAPYLQDTEKERFIKASVGEDCNLTLGLYAEMLAKIRMFKARNK